MCMKKLKPWPFSLENWFDMCIVFPPSISSNFNLEASDAYGCQCTCQLLIKSSLAPPTSKYLRYTVKLLKTHILCINKIRCHSVSHNAAYYNDRVLLVNAWRLI